MLQKPRIVRLSADTAAALLQNQWRDRRVLRLSKKLLALREAEEARQAREDARLLEREARRQEHWAREDYKRTLPGALERVWPILREAGAVMLATLLLVSLAPPAFGALPAGFDLQSSEPVWVQTRAALVGASVAVAAFAALFLSLVLLYVYRCTFCLYALHTVWIASLLGVPLLLLLLRVCEAIGLPVDALTLVAATWNVLVPGLVLVHWSPTAERFRDARRLYAGLLATLAAWLLASVPWPTAVAALLMLAGLDVLLVSFPGSPVQRLDAIASARRRAGELEMPGLTFKSANGDLELGLGDFIVYSAFAAHASRIGMRPLCAVSLGVLGGLVHTMSRIALSQRRLVLPALPLSIALGALLLVAERCLLRPLAEKLAEGGVFL